MTLPKPVEDFFAHPTTRVLLAISALINLLMLVPSLYMLQIFDRILVSQSLETLLVVTLLTFYLLGLQIVGDGWRNKILVERAHGWVEHLEASLASSLIQSAGGFGRHFSSVQAGLKAANDVRAALVGSQLQAGLDLLFIPLLAIALFLLHPAFLLLLLVLILLQCFVLWRALDRLKQPQAGLEAAEHAETAWVRRLSTQADWLEAQGLLGPLVQRWRRSSEAGQGKRIEAEDAKHDWSAISKSLRYAQQGLSLGLGAYLVIEGSLSAGAMIAANVISSRALAPIDQLTAGWQTVLQAKSSLHQLELLRADPLPSAPLALGRITPKETLTLPAKEAGLVLVGASGAGKTTLLKSGLRDSDGWLAQQPQLFAATVAQNIAAMGPFDSTRVIWTANLWGVHDDILRLPKGYETALGEQGQGVSAGLRQRIALCRAAYPQADTLLLDEPETHLDAKSREGLLEGLRSWLSGGGRWVIATHWRPIWELAEEMIWVANHQIEAQGPRVQLVPMMQKAGVLR